MEENKKHSNWLAVILILLVIGLGGYIVYDKVVKPYCTANTKVTSSSKTTTNKTVSTPQKEYSADELYAKYLKNLKTNLSNIDTNKDANVAISSNSYIFDGYYSFKIDKDGNLLMTIDDKNYNSKYNNYVLSKNVLQMFLVNFGNGGYKTLYFIKEDGTLNKLCVECIADGQFSITQDSHKNIVNIVSANIDISKGGSWTPIFIDIEGNTFTE
jgi:hypothetical protein